MTGAEDSSGTALGFEPGSLELILRGFSPRELAKNVERECRQHFGQCAWRIDESTCVACMGSLGGRVRLYEAHVVASPVAASD
jgi:hypothetical protein